MASMNSITEGIDLMIGAGLKGAPEFDGNRLATWATLCDDMADDDFRRGCLQMARTATFFPTPGEIRTGLKGPSELKATEAWELVRSAIRKHGYTASLMASDIAGDGHALWAVARMGAESIGNMTDEDRAIRAAEFRRLYAVALERGYKCDYLPGLFETQNRAMALSLEPAMVGRLDAFLGEARALTGSDVPPIGGED